MLADQAVYNAVKHLAATYPDVAPESSPLPRIVYQQVGGESINYTEDTQPAEDRGRVQVACWAQTRAAASTLARQVEQAIRQASGMQARPLGARVSMHEPDTGLYGTNQDFEVWSDDSP